VDQDVLGLDVAVDDPVPVRVVQRVRHVAGDAHGFLDTELTLPAQLVTQRLAVNERHDVEQKSVGRAGVEQGQDVGMLERRRGLDLLDEPLGAEDRRQLGPQHLDRDLPVVLQVLGQIHRRHPTLAEVTFEAIAVGQGGGEAARDLGHGARVLGCLPCSV
jgi:hypothetical protein